MVAGSGDQERMLAELERLKQRAGLSFAQLQGAVPYSRSALHRYFTGQAPIPRDALVAVVQACGGDAAEVVPLWEAAQGDPALALTGVAPVPVTKRFTKRATSPRSGPAALQRP